MLDNIYNKLCKIERMLERKEYRPSKVKDLFLEDYINDETISSFLDKTTNECYEVYKQSREQFDFEPVTICTIRTFNDIVKKTFNLNIKHITRNGKNLYIWSKD